MSVKLKVITVGDKTTTGGTVKNGALTVFCQGRPVALIDSESFCPQCKTLGVIRQTRPFNVFTENKQVCLENDVVECGCPIGTNRLIASPDAYEFIGYDDGSVSSTISYKEVPDFIQNGGNTLFSTGEKEPEQHAQVAKKQNSFADICKPKDNQLLNGVYLWTETTSAGHVFVSVHDNNSICLYTYGRYGRTDKSTFTGDGILDFFQDEDARKYYRYELYEMGARAFRIDDADPKITRNFFESLWNSGVTPIQTPNMQDGTKRRGRTIDKYDVTDSNCTTHSVEGIKFAGSKLFDHGYTSTTTQLPIDIEDDFTIPVSLQSYLESKSVGDTSILVVEMTNILKQQYPNTENKSPQPMGGSAKIQQPAADSAAVAGSTSPYSGGTVGGSLGSTYDDE
ncbi:PAAR domain-containing protein [Kluyvera chengduensis]|uniref:PAAR domain-containing protein n=1 Tax=Kluyvera sp. 142359 TaxID=3375726 RepID=UPI003770E4D5